MTQERASLTLSTWGLDIVALTQAPVTLSTNYLNNTPVPIPSTAPPIVVNSTINVPDQRVVCGVEITTPITHTFPSDIDMTVMSPSGRVVTLTTDNGASNDNVFSSTTWRNRTNVGGTLPYVNQDNVVGDHLFSAGNNVPTLSPEESLAAFSGEPSNGTWTLTISDDANNDGGTLASWTLTILTCSEPDSDSDILPDSCDACPVDSAKFSPGQCGCGVSDVDTDADGTANCNDSCPADASKLSPGACGCGTADVDANANQVADCLKPAELKARVVSAAALLAKVKVDANGNLTKAGKSNKKKLLTLLTDISNFVGVEGAGIAVAANKNLTTLHQSMQNKVRKVLRTLTAADRKAANKALNALKNAIL